MISYVLVIPYLSLLHSNRHLGTSRDENCPGQHIAVCAPVRQDKRTNNVVPILRRSSNSYINHFQDKIYVLFSDLMGQNVLNSDNS